MNGLITISKYWKRWADPRLIVLVLNNRDLNQVTWELRAMSGDPKFESSQDVPDFPYAKYAELLGLKGIFVNDPDKVGSAWDEAFAADRPVVLEAYTDPDVPPCRRIFRLRTLRRSCRRYGKATQTNSESSSSRSRSLSRNTSRTEIRHNAFRQHHAGRAAERVGL